MTEVILNRGAAAWAFEEVAGRLSRAWSIPVSDVEGEFNYVLGTDEDSPIASGRSFIPFGANRIASDKRLVASAFARAGVPSPITVLADSREAVDATIAAEPAREWCVKFPTGCGAGGHRTIASAADVPIDWPTPIVLQEFVRLAEPEVYRTYAFGRELFGWNVRRFPPGVRTSPWVAHARGARYEWLSAVPPADAGGVAVAALHATNLLDSFGCVDLLRRDDGAWLALEVGTDGIYNHVDRDVGNPEFERSLNAHLGMAFFRWTCSPAAAP
ncbi:MAG TPA: hypothetical protein VEA69_07895 [Tepidisphaeraceae bacterium]|nr:hypothetical protein [Tepidisphaeraceae bacterium]